MFNLQEVLTLQQGCAAELKNALDQFAERLVQCAPSKIHASAICIVLENSEGIFHFNSYAGEKIGLAAAVQLLQNGYQQMVAEQNAEALKNPPSLPPVPLNTSSAALGAQNLSIQQREELMRALQAMQEPLKETFQEQSSVTSPCDNEQPERSEGK